MQHFLPSYNARKDKNNTDHDNKTRKMEEQYTIWYTNKKVI